MKTVIELLRAHDVRPTPQRIATVEVILTAGTHPSADELWAMVKRQCPTVSRATVYNTLNLLVEKGVLKAQILTEGKVVFDPCVHPHHHFIDEETGRIYDIPWDEIHLADEISLRDFEVTEYQIVMRGRKKKRSKSK